MTGLTLLAAELIGVAVFAASGASAAVAKRLDLFGCAVPCWCSMRPGSACSPSPAP